jgi:hypothetical protein
MFACMWCCRVKHIDNLYFGFKCVWINVCRTLEVFFCLCEFCDGYLSFVWCLCEFSVIYVIYVNFGQWKINLKIYINFKMVCQVFLCLSAALGTYIRDSTGCLCLPSITTKHSYILTICIKCFLLLSVAAQNGTILAICTEWMLCPMCVL